MNEFMYAMGEFFSSPLGTAIKAILLLILAFICAAIAKSLVAKLLSRTKLAQIDADKTTKVNVAEMIAKFVQLVVFLLFVPGIFECLGMTQVSAPILTMLNSLLGYIPNILGAAIVLWIGFFAAKLVRELLIPVLNRLEVNKLQKIAGIEVSDAGKLSNTIAYIVYVLILIPIIITALYVLNIKAITDPAVSMLQIVFNYIPSIIAALVIIAIGWILARFIGSILTRLIAASGLDAKLAAITGTKNEKLALSNVAGKTVEVVLIVFFVVEALTTLHLGVLSTIGMAVIGYLPNVLAAFLIFLLCFFIAAAAGRALDANGKKTAGILVRYLVYITGGFFILNQLGIATVLVNSAFILAIAALAVAFALAFGLGGRTFAGNVLKDVQKKFHIGSSDDPKAE